VHYTLAHLRSFEIVRKDFAIYDTFAFRLFHVLATNLPVSRRTNQEHQKIKDEIKLKQPVFVTACFDTIKRD
jgi:hypothetical protein